ncbi:MAG: PEFG-CTERM sorting domain-containing protein [Nanoarchaeota archaeon]|nr:PEFG-CTERM sorting domain-containing protein [Nanoarchaeota archaeon]
MNFVKTKIIFALLILGMISTLPAFAESLITIKTNSNSYKEGDTVVISGKVTTIIIGTPITMQIFSQGNLVDVAQFNVAEDGSYSYTIIAEGPYWTKSGEYVVRASFGEGNVAETQFSFSPKSEVVDTDIFEVDAGSHGTFDVNYSISGGVVKNMLVDKDILALIVIIETDDDGSITLEMPRSAFDAKKQDQTDDTFIIIIDGIEVPYQETVTNTDSRIITINFEEGDSDIEIIGTTIIPEFGTIAVMILAVGIITTIIITRNRFQIHI